MAVRCVQFLGLEMAAECGLDFFAGKPFLNVAERILGLRVVWLTRGVLFIALHCDSRHTQRATRQLLM